MISIIFLLFLFIYILLISFGIVKLIPDNDKNEKMIKKNKWLLITIILLFSVYFIGLILRNLFLGS